MGEYYAYLIGHDGHITKRIDIVCENDEEAKNEAQQLVDGHDIELWQRARKIAAFKAKD